VVRAFSQTGQMSSSPAAELSSLLTLVEDVAGRVTVIAERFAPSEHHADLVAALHGAERALRAATRDLRRAEKASH
jgi:hypothetical protein